MKVFRKVIVATDFGASSRCALDLAVDIAETYGAELVLVHAVEPFTPPYPVALLPGLGTLEDAARAALADEAARVTEAIPNARHEVLSGAAATTVTDFAEREGADLLVVGTHGRRGPSRWLLGSVAEKIVRASRIPVLTVRG